MTSLALPVLGVTAAVLAAVVVMEVGGAHRQVRGVLSEASTASRNGAQVGALGEIENWQDWVDISIARPLFEPDRRPPTTAAGAVSNTMPRLAGIIITPAERSAIFVEAAGGHPIIVMKGSRLNDFVVRSIDADTVTIVTSDGVRVIHWSFATSKPPATAEADSPPLAFPLAALASQPPAAPGQNLPFSSIRGLNGRPMGLVANPDQASPPTGAPPDLSPGLPPRARPESSP